MARQQVLSSIPQNQGSRTRQNTSNSTLKKSTLDRNTMTQLNNRRRSASLSSRSSVSSPDSTCRMSKSKKNIMSASASPDENMVRKDRLPFTEMFSPVRAIRAARAGMKRKRGGGPLVVASTRAALRRGSNQIHALSGDYSMDMKRMIRGTKRRESRNVSNTLLHRGMKAMVLTDNEPEVVVSLRPDGSSRKASTSGSVRSSRFRLQRQGQEESEDEVIDDAEEGESRRGLGHMELLLTFVVIDERLLLQAPSWQLHRLKKTKLFKLHVMLGTWQEGGIVDLDLYNKQELVEGLVKARSGKVNSRNVALSAETSMDQISPSSRPKNLIKRANLSSAQLSHSSAYTDEEDSASETEANDAGGEETEAEPITSAKRRQSVRMSRLYANQSVASPMVNRLRKSRPRGVNVGNEVHFAREGFAKGSTSSGVSSPLGRRIHQSRSSFFTASSPIRTRQRTQNQSSASLLRLSLPANRATTARDVFPRRTENGVNQTPKQQRRKRTVNLERNIDQQDEAQRESESDDRLEWEDASPTSLRTFSINPPRKAKLRAQEQLHQLHGQNKVVEDAEDGMSIDETPTKLNSKVRSTTSNLTADNLSDGDFSSEDEGDDDNVDWEEEGHPSESDINASPSKMRKLRNGKIRLLATDINAKRQEVEQEEEEQDVEMEDDAKSVSDLIMIAPTASSLNRLRRNQLIQLCEKYNVIKLEQDATKAALIDALLSTHATSTAPGSASTEKAILTASSKIAGPDSRSSAQTSRARRTKKANGQSSSRKSKRLSEKPLLLRSHSKEVQTSKPASPVPMDIALSPTTNEEELNGLDLESLNLVDKEIPFSKLEKMEKIGSGGFKDVYIGKYQISKKTIKRVAIADIRDQLSEMDIKELTLLRDLKHENIVRFIGVCVPPVDMRTVPCMIVSELCSNGDLFDYIRNVPAPADEEIVSAFLDDHYRQIKDLTV